ncbi:response regulator [Methylobrevis pamukkalensis]|uniref:Chemotaxis protein CheY n=1 Tax=Methylobrevis pamukkalensis TaxID=1439726 RepID=A0A1E3GZQ8_9HYPH|nr:response regulator [Methylobrevis pamukkalensis]ODN69522.1 Chemotaxis protein CheY [Methylobrevis pamukkalensis]
MDTLQVLTNPLKVMVADDSATVRKFTELALRECDSMAEITLVADGREAVHRLTQDTFDIAFLDINMPHITGVEVMGALHLQKSSTFAISMSNSLSDHSESLLKSFGAYDFLTKPFGKGDVRQILNTYGAIRKPLDILIVDDSGTVRRIVSKVLARSIFNLRLVEAEDGAAALRQIKDRRFGIIFADFNMPGMTGIELAGRIAAEIADVDVILMSTEFTDTLEQAAQRVGARAFLRKPFFPEDVDSILHHLFRLRHPRFSKQVRIFATT